MVAHLVFLLRQWNRFWSQSQGKPTARRHISRINEFDESLTPALIEQLEERTLCVCE